MKNGYLEVDELGYYHLIDWDERRLVEGYESTNALLPAISRARQLGYEPGNI